MKKISRIVCTMLVFVMIISSFGYATVLDSTALWYPVVDGTTYTHSGRSHLNSNYLSAYGKTGAPETMFGRRVETTFTYYDSDTQKTYTKTSTKYYPSGAPLSCEVSFSTPSSMPNAKITNVDSSHITYYGGSPYPTYTTHCVW